MLSKLLVIGTIILILVFGGVFYYEYTKTTKAPVSTEKPNMQTQQVNTEQSAASEQTLDETLNEFENISNNEGTAANEEDDSAAVIEDSTAISDFGQSYDESQF